MLIRGSFFLTTILVLFACSQNHTANQSCETSEDCPKSFTCDQTKQCNEPKGSFTKEKGETSKAPSKCKLIFEPILSFGQVMPGESKVLTWDVKHRLREPCLLSRFVTNSQIGSSQTIQILESRSLPTTLRLNQSFQFKVIYKPTKPGLLQHKLQLFAEHQQKSVASLEIRGFSMNRCALKSILAIQFEDQASNCASQAKLISLDILKKDSCAPTTHIKNIRIEGPDKSSFILQKNFSTPHEISDKKAAYFHVQFFPKEQKQHFATLIIEPTSSRSETIQVPLFGTSSSSKRTKIDTYYSDPEPKVDVLLVVNPNRGMGPFQANIRHNIKELVSSLQRASANFHIGVTTTDTSGQNHKKGCLVGKFSHSESPSFVDRVLAQVMVGTSGTQKNRSLESLVQTLKLAKENKEPCIQGFYRENAQLSVIFFSHNDDQSEGSVRHYINQLKQLKKGGFRRFGDIRVSSIVPIMPKGCTDQFNTHHKVASRLYEYSRLTLGIQSNICSQTWWLFSHLMFYWAPEQFELTRVPLSSSIHVRINGKTLKQSRSEGWSYEPQRNAIRLSKMALPPPSSKIEISYTYLCF